MATSKERLKSTSMKQTVKIKNKSKKIKIRGKLTTYLESKQSLKQQVRFMFVQLILYVELASSKEAFSKGGIEDDLKAG